jgi:Transglutaminase-like superfamily/TgpA N-terminal domain
LTIIATAWTLLATGWVDGAGGALVVALAAVVEAAVLAYARVPRLLVVALIPVLALAAIIPATLSTLPIDGDSSFWHLLARYVGASFNGLASSDDWPFTVGLCAVLWLCGYWMTWVALREHRGVFAVLPVYIIVATNVLNARTGHDVALPTALAVGASLLVIANAQLDSLQVRWQRRQVKALSGIRSGMVGSTAVVAVAILIVGSLLPRVTTEDISGNFFTGGNGSGSHAGAGDAAGGGSPASIAFNAATQPGGPLVSSPKPVLTYTSSTAAPVYLRVVNDTEFSQGNWYPEHGVSTTPDHRLAFASVTFDGGSLPLDTSPADGGVGDATALVTIQATLKPNATGDVDQAVFAGDPRGSSASGVAFGTVNVSHATPQLLTVDYVQLGGASSGSGSSSITTTGALSAATQDQLRNAGTAYPAFVQRYTELHDDGTHGVARIAALAREWTHDTANPYDQATAIEQRLRDPTSFTYTLTPPRAPAADWPVVYFLTQSHRGYCQYFASAMGAMLRSLGIPTRLVNGYGPGTTLAAGNRHGQRVQQVTTSDAHTWVEAYFPGHGWIPFEPTPPSAQGDYLPIARGSVSGPSSAGATDVNPRPGSSNGVDPIIRPQPPTRAPAHQALAAPDLHYLGLGLLGAVALAVVVLLLWLLFPQSQRGAWQRLEVVGTVFGVRRRAHETHRAYAQRFEDALADARQRSRGSDATSSPGLGGEILDLARSAAATEFAPPGRDTRLPSATRRLWLRLLRAAPALAWRTVARRHAAT